MGSAVDHVLQAFSPLVVIFSDANVDRACEINGCKGLDQLFKPWQSRIERVPILSSLLTRTTYPTYAIRFVSHSTLIQSHSGGGGTVPYSPETMVDIISHLIAVTDPEQNLQYDILRDVLLGSSPLDDHDSFNYPVCHMFATSSSSIDPLSALHDLSREAQESPVLANMASNHVVNRTVQRFYLLVHDVAREGPDLTRPRQIMERISATYGPHCSLLVINSKVPLAVNPDDVDISDKQQAPEEGNSTPNEYMMALHDLICVNPFSRLNEILDENVQVQRLGGRLIARRTTVNPSKHPYAQFLAEQDIKGIRECIRGVTVQSIIPWMELKAREWNELYSQTKKGVAAKLFGAGRKLFGSASPPTEISTDSRSWHPTNSQYTEGVIRRLADFAFMLKDYRQASSVYEAMLVFPSAVAESWHSNHATIMRAASTLLSAKMSKDVSDILDGRSLRTSLSVHRLKHSCRPRGQHAVTGFDDLGVLLLLIEIFDKTQLVTSMGGVLAVRDVIFDAAERAEDVCRAILLQKAATVAYPSGPRSPRKRALDFMLASQNYARCGLRTFSEANLLEVVDHIGGPSLPWRYIKDHVVYTLAQLEYTSGKAELAEKRFLSMLAHSRGSLYQEGILQDATLAHKRFRLKGESSVSPFLPPESLWAPLSVSLFSKTAPGLQGDQAPPLKCVVTFINRTTLPLRFSDIVLWLTLESDRSAMLCPCEQKRSWVILPCERRKILFDTTPDMRCNVKHGRVTYTLQNTFDFAQQLQLNPYQDPDDMHSMPAGGGASAQERNFDNTGNLSGFPLVFKFLGVNEVVGNHETLGFTLSLFNNSGFEISAISFRSSNPEWHVSWPCGEGEVVDNPSGPQSENVTNLVKVLRPTEHRLLAGTVTAHASHQSSTFDGAIEYTYRGIKYLQHEKHISSLIERPLRSNPTAEITLDFDRYRSGIICDIDLERRTTACAAICGERSILQHFPQNSTLPRHSVSTTTHKAQLYRASCPTTSTIGDGCVFAPVPCPWRAFISDGQILSFPVRISDMQSRNLARANHLVQSSESRIEQRELIPARLTLRNRSDRLVVQYDVRRATLSGGLEMEALQVGKLFAQGECPSMNTAVATLSLFCPAPGRPMASTWMLTVAGKGGGEDVI